MHKTAGYWGDEYLDAVKHELGVGDGDPAPELPDGLAVPEVVKPAVQRQYAELLASEAPDPRYFLQGVQVAVINYFDDRVEHYSREADTIKMLADGFAEEEFFSWRGGSPEYGFWALHEREIAALAAEIGTDPDALFDDLGKLAIDAAVKAGAELTQEIQEARAGVDEKIAEIVDEDWNQPVAKITAMWNDFLNEVENPRDVTVEDLLSLLDPVETYLDRTHMFGDEFAEAAQQELPRLAEQVLRAPDPRQTEIQFPKRRGRPQKHFYKKSALDPDHAWEHSIQQSSKSGINFFSNEDATFALLPDGTAWIVAVPGEQIEEPIEVQGVPSDSVELTPNPVLDRLLTRFPRWYRVHVEGAPVNISMNNMGSMGRRGKNTRSAEAVDADVHMLDAIWTDVDSEVAHILDAKYYESMSPRPGTSLIVGSLGKTSYSGVKHYISVIEAVTPDKLRGLPVSDLEEKEYYRLIFSLYQQACYTTESYLNKHTDHSEYGTYRVSEAKTSGTSTQIYFTLAS